MKRITIVDVAFASVVIVGLVFGAKPFFTQQQSEVLVVQSADLPPEITLTTLELPAKPSPPRIAKECATAKACDNSKPILAERESDSVKAKAVADNVDETPVPDASGIEYSSQGADSYSSEEMELTEYPYGQPTPYTTQVVDALAIPVTGDKPLTREQATQWKDDLQGLVELGSEGLPAIWEYLNSFEDTNFHHDDARALGYPSSRLALLDAVHQIGGDEAIELSLQMLQATADPNEIAFLAERLAEQETNEEAREAAVAAAREVLDMAKSGEIETEEGDEVRVDVGPLFEVLHKYGDDRVVADLQQATGEWRYYASIALANLPDGAGIPALVDMAKGDKEVHSSRRPQALVMLAQVSTQSEVAQNILIDAARNNQIPEFYWHSIASSLSGATYRLETDVPSGKMSSSEQTESKNFYISRGNQKVFVEEAIKKLSAEEIDERLALIDELLAVNSSPKATELLQKSQSELEDRFAQLPSKQL